jgi:hypothetical protein|nr:MAG TPA: hypothetical protein [Caudoviricetes sp.]
MKNKKSPRTGANSTRGKYTNRLKRLTKTYHKASSVQERLLILSLITYYQDQLDYQ